MPRALSSKQRTSVYLDSDVADFPDAAIRPTFIFRYLTGEEWMEFADLNDRIKKLATGRAVLDAIYKVIRVPLVGWENMRTDQKDLAKQFGVEGPDSEVVDLPYRPELLGKILGMEEANELLGKIIGTQRPSGDDRKNFESPALSGQALNAAVAPVVNALNGQANSNLPD